MIDALAAALWEDRLGVAFVSVSVVALFAGAEAVSRWRRVPVEWTRKATHLGAGAVVFGFPWWFSHTASVAVLALAFAGILIGGRVTGLLGSIHNVQRRTGGAYYYPFAVLGVWWVSGGDPLLFCTPLAIMAVADTGAALVGQRAGETTYQVMDGVRSLEGSLAFFGLAFAIVLVGTAVAGRPGWPAALLVTFVVAALTTSVEAVSVRGSDNVGIPYAAWLALEHTERLGLDALGDWVLGMSLGAVLLFVSARRARLDPAGAVVVFLVSTLSYALGGWTWFAPLGALYAGYLVARTPDPTSLDRVFPTTAASMIVVLAFAHTGRADLYEAFLATVCASGAMGGVLVARARRWPKTLLALAGSLVPAVIARVVDPDPYVVVPFLAGLAAAGALWLARRGPPVGRRVAIALLAGAASWWLTT